MSTKLKEIWLVLRREGFFFFGGGGCLQFRRGELGWERRRRNKGGEGQQSGDIIHFCRWNHRRTPSVDDFVYNSNGELVMSLYVGPNLNPLVTPLVKSPAKTSTSANHIFYKKNWYISFVILAVDTDWSTDEIVSVGIYHRNVPDKIILLVLDEFFVMHVWHIFYFDPSYFNFTIT